MPLEQLGLRVQTTLSEWPDLDKPLTAGVSSFSMGGTNAHLILQQPPPRPHTNPQHHNRF
ncbi:hypothetical protein OIO89_00985 (plasmid) [Mycobacterium ulcerans]|nr:hypothetical protein OIO89_00985 [Mycobacterium ulcerans]